MLNELISLASIIEGSMKSYLSEKLTFAFNDFKDLPNKIEIMKKEKVVNFSSIEDLKKRYASAKEIMEMVKNQYLKDRSVFDKTLPFFNYKISFKISKRNKDQGINQSFINEVKNIIEQSTWNTLKSHYRKIKGNQLKIDINKSENKTSLAIDKLFEFRNFIVHSNSIEFEFNAADTTYQGKVKKLIDYINKNNLQGSSSQGYFVEQIINEKILGHFKRALDEYLNSGFLDEYFATSNLKNQIWKG